MEREDCHMRKQEQLKINKICDGVFNASMRELRRKLYGEPERLRSCKAWVYETKHFYVLRSYNTFIACISKKTDVLYDNLRREYGYTSTSAQHISKFSQDYGIGTWGCEKRYTYREV